MTVEALSTAAIAAWAPPAVATTYVVATAAA